MLPFRVEPGWIPPPPIGVPGATTGGAGLEGTVGCPEPVPAPEETCDSAPARLAPATTAMSMASAMVSASLCLI